MIDINSNVGFIIICAVFICDYWLIFRSMFDYSNQRQFIAWIEFDDPNMICCSNEDRKYTIVLSVVNVLLLVISFILIRSGYKVEIFALIAIIYMIVVIIHLILYKQYSQEYYMNDEGVWLKGLNREPVPWDEIQIEKEGKSNTKFKQLLINEKRYILNYGECVFFDEEDNGKNIIEETDLNQSIESIKKNILAEKIVLIISVIMIVICATHTARATGDVLYEHNGTIDYESVYYEEQAPYAKPNIIYESEEGLVYVSKKGYACLNVYNCSGVFLYAYHPPMGFNRGESVFAIENSLVYIKNRKAEVYCYEGTNFICKINETECPELDYIQESTNKDYQTLIYGHKIFIGSEGICGILIGLFLYTMSFAKLEDAWDSLRILVRKKMFA